MKDTIHSYNKDQWEELLFSLRERSKPATVMAVFDTGIARREIIKELQAALPELQFHNVTLPAKRLPSLSDYLRNKLKDLQPNSNFIRDFVHIQGLEKHLFTRRDGELKPSPLARKINMERETLFHKLPAILFFSTDRESVRNLSQQAPDFWDWIGYFFEFQTPSQLRSSLKVPSYSPRDFLARDYKANRKKTVQQLRGRLNSMNQNQPKKRLWKNEFNLREALAQELYHLGKFDESLSEIREAMFLSEQIGQERTHQLHFYAGIDYTFKNETNKAIGALKDAIHKSKKTQPDPDGNLPVAYFALGLNLSEKNRWDEAIDAYEKAIALKPDYGHAWFNLGNARARKGALAKAAEAFKQALKINAEDYEALNNLANVYTDQGHYKQAIRAYKKALKIKPDHYESWYNLGIAHLADDHPGRALKALKNATSLKATNPYAWYTQGLAHDVLKHHNKAQKAYKKAVELKPDYQEAWQRLGNLYAQSNQHKKAREAYQKASLKKAGK